MLVVPVGFSEGEHVAALEDRQIRRVEQLKEISSLLWVVGERVRRRSSRQQPAGFQPSVRDGVVDRRLHGADLLWLTCYHVIGI